MPISGRPTISDSAMPLLPEPGQVVEVRGSTWAVANVQAQGLPRSPADEATAQLSHVVDLQSLDEDRLGEELSVVWELEVGHTVTPAQGLPDAHQRRARSTTRPRSPGSSTRCAGARSPRADPNRYQAPFWSGVNVEAYQLEPLRRALGRAADQPAARRRRRSGQDHRGRPGDPGAVPAPPCPDRGHRVPAEPGAEVAGRDAREVRPGVHHRQQRADGARCAARHGLHANPFQLFPRVIVSMAWLPQVRAQRLLRDVYAQASNPKTGKRFAFDILVVDEAHHVAPSSPSAIAGGRGYAVDTQRTVAVRQLADKCEHRLFLSATPHNGHPESFTALMEMIDSRRFSRGALLDSNGAEGRDGPPAEDRPDGQGLQEAQGQHARRSRRATASRRCSPCSTTSSPRAPSRTAPSPAATS